MLRTYTTRSNRTFSVESLGGGAPYIKIYTYEWREFHSQVHLKILLTHYPQTLSGVLRGVRLRDRDSISIPNCIITTERRNRTHLEIVAMI